MYTFFWRTLYMFYLRVAQFIGLRYFVPVNKFSWVVSNYWLVAAYVEYQEIFGVKWNHCYLYCIVSVRVRTSENLTVVWEALQNWKLVTGIVPMLMAFLSWLRAMTCWYSEILLQMANVLLVEKNLAGWKSDVWTQSSSIVHTEGLCHLLGWREQLGG